MNDPLEILLHRCHREELLPLAEQLRVRHEGLGLGQLAKALSLALRQRASHPFSDAVLRRGQGLPYPTILSSIAEKLQIRPGDIVDTEVAILQHWLFREWQTLPKEERESRWKNIGLSLPLPIDASTAGTVIHDALGSRSGYALSNAWLANRDRELPKAGMALFGSLGCVLRPLFVPFLPVFIWWMLRPTTESIVPFILEIARLRQLVLHRVTIGVVGSPSTGKDAAIKVLFGIDTGNVSPIAGSTKEVTIQRLEGATALFVVNTPGMGDVLEKVTEEAKQVLDHIDVYIYLINAEGGVQARELSDYQRCSHTGKPVLAVVNKVDVLRPADREAFLLDARQKLGCREQDFVAVAFDPLPQLSPTPINVGAVQNWLEESLQRLGKLKEELPWYQTTDTSVSEAEAWPPGGAIQVEWPMRDLYGKVTLLIVHAKARVSAVDGIVFGEWESEVPDESLSEFNRRLRQLPQSPDGGTPNDAISITVRGETASPSRVFSERGLQCTPEGAAWLHSALAMIELATYGEVSL